LAAFHFFSRRKLFLQTASFVRRFIELFRLNTNFNLSPKGEVLETGERFLRTRAPNQTRLGEFVIMGEEKVKAKSFEVGTLESGGEKPKQGYN